MIYVAQSVWRHLDPLTAQSVNAAQAQAPADDPICWEVQVGDALIARSRSALATKFLEQYPDADVMVIVDDDINFDPADLFKIVEGARETGALYGGIYVTRSREPHPAARMWPNTDVYFEAGPVRKPFEVEYLATGFMAVPRSVLAQMVDAEFADAGGTHRLHRVTRGTNGGGMWTFFDPFTVREEDGELHYLSEDWAFCERARQMGVNVYGDASIILGHKALVELTVRDIGGTGDALSAAGRPMTRTDALTIETRDRSTGEPLIDSLPEDIAEWAGDRLGDIRRQLPLGSSMLADLWAKRTEPEAEWYRREDVGLAYILDLAHWHMNVRGWSGLAELAGKRVLDYGAGIGTHALIAARDGALVSAYEPNATMRDFMEWRAQKYGIRIEASYGARWGFSGRGFDALVAWHVFEHVERPTSVLDDLRRLLAPEGLLITESDFHRDDAHPMHHEHPDWDGVLRSHGFEAREPGIYSMATVAV